MLAFPATHRHTHTCKIPLERCRIMAERVLNQALRWGSLTPSSMGLSPAEPPAFSKCSDMYERKYFSRTTCKDIMSHVTY